MTTDRTANKPAKDPLVNSKSPVETQRVRKRNNTSGQPQSAADPASRVPKTANITEPVSRVNGRESAATEVTKLSISPKAKTPAGEAAKPRYQSKKSDADKAFDVKGNTAPTVSAGRLENVLSGKLFTSEKSLFGYKQVARYYRLRSDGSLLLFNDKKFSQEKLVSDVLCETCHAVLS